MDVDRARQWRCGRYRVGWQCAGGPHSHNNDNEINGNVPAPHKYNEQKHSGRSITVSGNMDELIVGAQADWLGVRPGQPGIMIDDDAWAMGMAIGIATRGSRLGGRE